MVNPVLTSSILACDKTHVTRRSTRRRGIPSGVKDLLPSTTSPNRRHILCQTSVCIPFAAPGTETATRASTPPIIRNRANPPPSTPPTPPRSYPARARVHRCPCVPLLSLRRHLPPL